MSSREGSIPEGGIRVRKMRKGTRSCLHCTEPSLFWLRDTLLTDIPGRRRKIKCLFLPELKNVCTECHASGNECVSQESVHSLAIPAERRTLRDRLSRLENLLQSANLNLDESLAGVADFPRTKKRKLENSDTSSEDPTDLSFSHGGHVDAYASTSPLRGRGVSLTRRKSGKELSGEEWTEAILDAASISSQKSKDIKIRHALSSILCQLKDLSAVLKKNNTMWFMLKRVQHETSRDFVSFEEFANHTISDGTAYEIAQVCQVVAFSSGPSFFEQATFIVDRFIIADDDYMSTIAGLFCAVLQGNLYQESGQLRRAWQTFRRGLQQAEVILSINLTIVLI